MIRQLRLCLIPLVVALDPSLPLVARQAELVDLVPTVIPALNLTTRLNVSFDQPAGSFVRCSATYSYEASSFILSDMGTSRPSNWEARGYRNVSGSEADLYQYMPSLSWETQPGDLHTVIMVNPLFLYSDRSNDGPFFQHFMILNVQNGNISSGDLINSYLGPEALDTTYDRYVFLVYAQSHNIILSPTERTAYQTRTGFNLTSFVSLHSLGAPVAINWMFIRSDEWAAVQVGMRGGPSLLCAVTTTLHQWVFLDYDVSPATKEAWIANKSYIKENNCLTGLKVWKGESYVTVPRWRTGVPSTLNKVLGSGNQSLLQPWPSAWFNNLANPSGVRYVQSMEIDSQGRMWILDTGRMNFFDANASTLVNGPAFLIVMDIHTQTILRKYEFPASVAPYDSVFLNDIVLDQLRGFAYITDTNTDGRGALIVYDYNLNLSHRFQDPSMLSEQDSIISINGSAFPGIDSPMDGIALSPDTDTLYYCVLRGVRLYAIPTLPLRNFTLSSSALSAYVTFVGEKLSQSDGLAMTASGSLIFGALSLSTVYTWSTLLPLSSQIPLVAPSLSEGQWPDTFAFDDDLGAILYTTNRLQRYFFHTMDFSGAEGANFRVLRVANGDHSYLFSQSSYGTSRQCPNPPPCEKTETTVFIVVIAVLGAVVLLLLGIAYYLSRTKTQLKSSPLLG